MPLMTLKAWKDKLKPGMKLLCVYRWYWNQPGDIVVGNLGKTTLPTKKAPEGGELCELLHVRATQATYKTPDKPLVFLDYPRASELTADEKGFELYFPTKPELDDPRNGPSRSGKLMSRYIWVPVLLLCAASLFAESKYFIKSTHVGPGAVAVSCLNGGDPTVRGNVGGALLVSCGR